MPSNYCILARARRATAQTNTARQSCRPERRSFDIILYLVKFCLDKFKKLNGENLGNLDKRFLRKGMEIAGGLRANKLFSCKILDLPTYLPTT